MAINFQYFVGGTVYFLNLSKRIYLCDEISMYSFDRNDFNRLTFSSDFLQVSYQDGRFHIKTFSGDILSLNEEDWLKFPVEGRDFIKFLGGWKTWDISIKEVGVGKNCLIATNRVNNKNVIKNGNFRDIHFNELAMFMRDGKDLIALGDEIEEVWREPLYDGRKLIGLSYELHTHGSLILFNQGLDRKTRTGCLTALNKTNGSEVWTYQYSVMPEYAFVHEGLYYSIESGVIVSLNPENGEVIAKIDLKLGEQIVLLPIGGYFVIASIKTKKLYLFDVKTHGLNDILDLPEGFCFSGAQFNLSESHLFVELQSDHPAFGYSTKALLTIPMVNGFPDFEEDMRLENRLSMPMMLTEGADGERVYLFTVSCDSLDDLIRLGSIEIFEFACAYGEPVIGPHMNPDVKHKGKVKVVVDSDVLPEGCEETVKEWGKNLSYCLEKSAVFPGAGDQYRFDVQVELR